MPKNCSVAPVFNVSTSAVVSNVPLLAPKAWMISPALKLKIVAAKLPGWPIVSVPVVAPKSAD